MPSLTLPYPPSTNHLYATVRGRRVLSKAGKDYKHAVFELFHQLKGVLVEGAVRLSIGAVAPDRRRRDLDNLLKITQDSLTGLAWGDDSQIRDVRIFWFGEPKAPGSIFVEYGPC